MPFVRAQRSGKPRARYASEAARGPSEDDSHLASGANTAATVRFYTEVLGMELVLRQPNLDYAPEDQFLFDVGNDNFIA
jgi:hypothetical protein